MRTYHAVLADICFLGNMEAEERSVGRDRIIIHGKKDNMDHKNLILSFSIDQF